MKRTDIRAGVVYAIKSSYGPPAPVVFLEDRAAGLYQREPYGKQGIRVLEENSYTKARRGSGFSDSARGYAALEANRVGNITYDSAAELMAAADLTAELPRFLADENPSAEGLRFMIITSLNQVSGLYGEEKAAYDAQQEAERAERSRKDEAAREASRRRRSILEALDAYGIGARDNSAGKIELSLDEADRLIALLRDIAPLDKG